MCECVSVCACVRACVCVCVEGGEEGEVEFVCLQNCMMTKKQLDHVWVD